MARLGWRAHPAAASRLLGTLGVPAGGGVVSPWSWLTLGLLAGLLGSVVVVFLVLQRRQREQMRALLDRLERLEVHLVEAGEREGAVAGGARAATGPESGGDSTITPSGDVLAGKTSYVRHLVESGGATAQGLADQAIFCVHKHLERNVTPGEIADELFVSLRTLERGLAVVLDCTPRQLILVVKMREARRLLRDERLRVSEVADRLGFANPFHFSRRFKSFYRIAPSELRQAANDDR